MTGRTTTGRIGIVSSARTGAITALGGRLGTVGVAFSRPSPGGYGGRGTLSLSMVL